MQQSTSTTAADSHLNRRQFLRHVAGLGLAAAGMALLDACASSPAAPPAAAEALETTTIRLAKGVSVCLAPQYLAEETLKTEGFTEVQYVEAPSSENSLAAGDVDICQVFAASILPLVEAEAPLVILSGVHVGCWELSGTQHINVISDLKVQTIP